MSLFYDAPKDFNDVTKKKKNEQAQQQQAVKQKVENTPAPYNKAKAAPTLSEQYKETAAKNKSSSSKSSQSKKSNSSSSGNSRSYLSSAVKKNNVRNDFSVGKETSIFSRAARDNVSSDTRNIFAPNAVFGSDVFGKISRGSSVSSKDSSNISADAIKLNPQFLYNNDNTAFYNDFQEKSSRNKQYNPFIAQTDILKQTGSHILNPDSNYIPSRIEALQYIKIPDKINTPRSLRKNIAPYVELGKKSDNILNSGNIVEREYGKKAVNNVLYDTVTYTTDKGKKIELLRDSAFTDKYDAQYLKKYMNNDQLNTYYYLLGKFGSDEAEDYLYNEVAKTAEDIDYSNLNIERNKKLAQENPIITGAVMPFSGINSSIQGTRNIVQDILSDDKNSDVINSRNTSASDAYYGRMQGVEEGEGSALEKLVKKVVYSTLYELPNMALSTIPVVGKGLSTVAGATSAMNDKYAQLRRDGNLDNAGATADVVLTGALSAADWDLIGDAMAAPAGSLIGYDSPVKAAISSVVENALSGAGVEATKSTIETAVDNATLGRDSDYIRAFEEYKKLGMSDGEAFKSAVYNVYLRPAATDAIIGAATDATLGIYDTYNFYADAPRPVDIFENYENNMHASLPLF